MGIEKKERIYMEFDPSDLIELCKKYHEKLVPAAYETVICPVCGSGSGPHRTGLHVHFDSDGKPIYTCWSQCHDHINRSDAFAIMGLKYNLSSFPDQVHALEREVGWNVRVYGTYTRSSYSKPRPTVPKPEKDKVLSDYSDYFSRCRKELDRYYPSLDRRGLLRGLSLEVLKRAGVGFDPCFVSPDLPEEKRQKISSKPVLVFPTSKHGFGTRDVRPESDIPDWQLRYSKQKVGKGAPFNLGCLYEDHEAIFIVEGEIDALSVMECGYAAIGLGSVSYAKSLVEEIKKNGKPKAVLILALDADQSGMAQSETLARDLKALGVPFIQKENMWKEG